MKEWSCRERERERGINKLFVSLDSFVETQGRVREGKEKEEEEGGVEGGGGVL